MGEIRTRKPEYLTESFSVAEIYQNLIPYRTHRDAVGVEMNADYENALLRLLAGEGDLLILNSEAARAEIREALEAGPTNTSFYREYAAASVRLNPDHLPPESGADILDDAGAEDRLTDSDAPGPSGSGEEVDSATVEDLIGTGGDVGITMDGGMTLADSLTETLSRDEDEPAPPTQMPDMPDDVDASITAPQEVEEMNDTTMEPEAVGDADDSSRCESCCATLPERADLNFCPFCGSDLRIRPCGACGEPVEPGWRFCVVCGAETPSTEEVAEE